jgi:16S rRNA (guanine966-N2)-methyltransferase
MRIVAGAAKGRRLVAPKGDDVRPTADRAKEALFASLQPLLAGARVLDLFAGSGALGLEALSRGAAGVTFVERDRAALQAIATNTEVVARPVARALGEDLPGSPFDLVLADPPYRTPKAEVERVLAAVVAHLAPGATVIIERSVRDGVPPWPPELERGDPRRYGDTALHRASMPTEPTTDPR